MLHFVRAIKLIPKINVRFYSNVNQEFKPNFPSNNVLHGCINHDIKLCDLKIEEINQKIELIEFQPYEKFFSEEQAVQNLFQKPTEEKPIPIDMKYVTIIEELNELKTEEFLPKKLEEAIIITRSKLLKFFPHYKYQKVEKIDNVSTLKFIKNLLYNTNNHASYIDVCIEKGDYEKALSLMNLVRKENKTSISIDKKSLIVDSVFYEPIIKLLGKKGKIEFIIKLLNEMDEFNILPNISIIFRTIEAASKKELLNLEFLHRMMDYIKRHNISLEEAMLKAPITKDNFRHILKAIQTIKPNFNIICKKPELKNKAALKETCIFSSIDELEKFFENQLQNEKLTSVNVDPINNITIDPEILKKVKLIEDTWRSSLVEAYEKKIALLEYSDRSKLYPYLSVLPTKSYVDAMIQVVYQLSTDSGLQFNKIQHVHMHIGNIISNMFRHRCLKKQKYFSQLKSICLSYFGKLSENPQNIEMDKLWESSIMENIDSGNIVHDTIEWSKKIKASVGKILYEIMFENMNFTFYNGTTAITTPVIYEKLEEDAGKVFITLKIQSKLGSLFRAINKALPAFSQLDMPMMHPPIPFHKNHDTGFFYLTNYATRFIRKATVFDIFDDDLEQPDDISKVYNALNVLSSCSWKIDKANLDLVMQVFNDSGNMKLKIPTSANKFNGPEKPTSDLPIKEKLNSWKSYFQFIKEQKEMFSLWSTLSYKIMIAQKFRNKQFWYPYSMDFRGRVYPCSPHLSHIGDDVSRGLLRFSLCKKLGPKGLDWIKIHLINLCGTHKRKSNNDRLKAANEAISEIIDSAVNPFDGRGWWQLSEKPWQTLATCREIHKILKFAKDKGNGKADDFNSTLPIHQDGSCNGLQHYAALGKDAKGAAAVNLIESETPQDVYSDVLEHLELKRKEDAENGITEAILLEGLLSRKVIKQTVMTTVYGVTQYGGTLQILRELKNLDKLPPENIKLCANYLSKLTLGSIGEIFASATNIQNWFVQVSSNISRLRRANISWKTPMNFIVKQPYFADDSDILKSDCLKNKNAFPPNFVHSLDSTHMMLTALSCWEKNITFVSVHDCFWTHACDVDEMNKICREEFVKLHSQPILENLSDYLSEKYQFQINPNEKGNDRKIAFNKLLKNIPQKGTFDIRKVLDSTYFFS